MSSTRIARSIGRARIETCSLCLGTNCAPRIARSIGRARIETYGLRGPSWRSIVSPDQLGGRGLKRAELLHEGFGYGVSPDQLVGRGLKRDDGRALVQPIGYRPINWSGAD